VNDELEKMWKEVIVDYFKAISQNFCGGTKDNHKSLGQDN
jgi:hypothetical protein